MEPSVKLTRQRTLYLDVVRVIAIISISLNHAVNRCYNNYTNQMAEFLILPFGSTLFKTVISVFSRIGVPLFLMITGALVMNKRMDNADDVKKFYRHNFLSLLITTEIWYFLMFWFQIFTSQSSVFENFGIWGTLARMVETMLFQNQLAFASMWYMPMILGVYLTLPFVIMAKDRLVSSGGGKVWYVPLVVLYLVSMVIPAINNLLHLLGMSHYFDSAITETYLFPFYYIYIIVGYHIGQGAFSRLKTWVVALVAVGTFLFCCGYQLFAYSQKPDYLVSYSSPVIPVCAGALFELCRRGGESFRRWEKPITYLSKIAFGIYFVHIVIMTGLIYILRRCSMPVLELRPVRVIFLEVVSVGGSILIIWLLSKVKIFKKYLFLIK